MLVFAIWYLSSRWYIVCVQCWVLPDTVLGCALFFSDSFFKSSCLLLVRLLCSLFLLFSDSERLWVTTTDTVEQISVPKSPMANLFSAFTCLSLFQLCVSFFVRVWDCHSLGLSFSLYLSSLGFCWACSSFINSRSSFTSLQLHTSWVWAECFNVSSLFVH